MATIKQRGNSYFITVSCGLDANGKKVRQTMTYKPDEKLSVAQIKKEVNRQAVLFEESVKAGKVNTAVKFEDYARQWFAEVAVFKLKERILANYHAMEKRVYKNVGHLRMDKITPRDIQRFILDMSEGERYDKYKKGKLAPKTIKNHVALISTIYEDAIKMQVVSHNPCRAVTFPKPSNAEREIYTLEETHSILELLHNHEPEKHLDFIVYFTLSIFTGFRRGELLGLEWRNFDFSKQTVSVNRTSNYTNGLGIFTDTPKTRTSYRTLKMPVELIDLLHRYRDYQAEYKASIGSKWVTQIEGLDDKMVDNDRLFTQWQGSPMHSNAPSLYFERFCKKHGLRYLSGHSIRHLHASANMTAGVDVKTLQMIMGHSSANTTLGIYCHAFQSAQAAAMDKFNTVISFPTKGKMLDKKARTAALNAFSRTDIKRTSNREISQNEKLANLHYKRICEYRDRL